MKRIDVKLNLPIVAPLLDVLRQAAETLGIELAAPLRVEDLDPDFRETWTEDLVKAQHDETALLLALFNDEFLATGIIRIDEQEAESFLRACAAFRLHLRSHNLRHVSDEQLETGTVNPDDLPESVRPALMAYVFLASLQELILEHFEGE